MVKKKEKPLTREDVLKMIEEHGGPEGLDLSFRNLEKIDLYTPEYEPALDLHGITLACANLQKASLWNANLQGAQLIDAELQNADFTFANLHEADLRRSNLQGAILLHTNLRGAKLMETNLKGAELYGCDLSDASLEEINWDPKYILEAERRVQKQTERDITCIQLSYTASTYRNLKRWHTEQGLYDIAGKFHFREMEVKRKALQWRIKPHLELWYWTLRLLCGYGERPLSVVISAVTVVLVMAIGIWAASALTFLDSLYYSAVSFTALGYGLWVSAPEGWVKALGATEAFIGVFMIALFLITFVRKMTR